MGTYSISDLSELTGVKTHTLRIWEKRYGLLQPQRTGTNIRYYDDRDLSILRLVQRLNHHGIRISRIAGMTLDEMESECRRISLRLDDHDEKLYRGLVDMDVTMIESVLDASILDHGFESTLRNLILPFIDKMEVMWLAGQIEEGQEACFRELVRRKTLREIDLMTHDCSGPRVIMFLPQGNRQELSHLFMHYFLKKQSLCITDIGCDINIECARSALQKCGAECVMVVNADPAHWQFRHFINELSHKTSVPIIISGKAADDHWHPETDQVIVLKDLEDTLQYTSRLRENLRSHLS